MALYLMSAARAAFAKRAKTAKTARTTLESFMTVFICL